MNDQIFFTAFLRLQKDFFEAISMTLANEDTDRPMVNNMKDPSISCGTSGFMLTPFDL